MYRVLTAVMMLGLVGPAEPLAAESRVDGAKSPAGPVPSVPAELVESPYRKLEGVPEGTIFHVATGVALTPNQLIDLLASRRVIYVGESHDNLRHHRIQLDILRALADRFPGKVAVGMEMFQRPAQPQLDRWILGQLSEEQFLSTWYENWTEDYDYYRDILNLVRDQRIPLLALNASPDMVRALNESAQDAAPSPEGAAIPEIDRSDPFHRRQLEAVFGVHATGDNFDEFYRTMLLWDETMAQTVAEFVTSPAGKDKVLIVFAGGGHVAYGFGIPRRAFRRAPVSYAVVLPHTDVKAAPADRPHGAMPIDPVALPLPVADFIWATGYESLEDSKVRLGVGIAAGPGGVAITGVAADSAAARAGLQEGDVIVAFDGQPIRKPVDLVRHVRARRPGDHASLTVTRGADTLTVEVSWPQ